MYTVTALLRLTFLSVVFSSIEMVFTAYVKQRIMFYHQQGHTSRAVIVRGGGGHTSKSRGYIF